jgi:hypothetical protein
MAVSSPAEWVKSSASLGALGRALSYLRGGVGSTLRGTGFRPGAVARRQTKLVAQQKDTLSRLERRAAAARKRANVSAQASGLGVESPATAKRLEAAAARLEARAGEASQQAAASRKLERDLNRMLAGKPPLPDTPSTSRRLLVPGILAAGTGGALIAAPSLRRGPEYER